MKIRGANRLVTIKMQLALMAAAISFVAATIAQAQTSGEGAAVVPEAPPVQLAAPPVPVAVNPVPVARLVVTGDFTNAEASIEALGPNGLSAPVGTCNAPCELRVPPGRYRIAVDAATNRREFERDFDVPLEGVQVNIHRGGTHGPYWVLTGVGIASTAVGFVTEVITFALAAVVGFFGGSGSYEGFDYAFVGGAVLIVGGVASIVVGTVMGSRGRRERIVIGPVASRRRVQWNVGAMPVPSGIGLAACVSF